MFVAAKAQQLILDLKKVPKSYTLPFAGLPTLYLSCVAGPRNDPLGQRH